MNARCWWTSFTALTLLGCATTSPISGRRYANLAVKPTDARFVAAQDPDCLRYRKYILVERFPNLAAITAGMPSRTAFEKLGKATGIALDLSSIPPAEMAMRSDQNIAIEWRTTAYWSLARRAPDERIETADIAVGFVKLTRSKTEIQQVGSPLFLGLDTGWFIEWLTAMPIAHNLKPNPKRR